ncbi:PRC-barrel domain protein [Rhodobacteraceae bacterium THAF1]|uniref:PRC-barrel domain-containing protein n=1 Tax=Palleronia sp. THAF1 TaxID=2587842 RepID=UPI000F3DD57F|nr:PRC-barrel domain-containing protein [Palleronia sp. THAF1]QFU09613.1 PRC-barrel domain protein [Palleronia sp. THAF1]VDC17486.1 PRC-barrel domain protein [Rhodobacteraceae bacterium THAF1]
MTAGTHNLVSSADVTGTTVYGHDGDKVGSIDRLMIDKQSGKVAYAVMSFGGILGIGGDERPVPWNTLTYDTSKDGFVTSITEAQLKDAPDAKDDWRSDRDWEKRTHESYGASPYWI